MHNNNNITYIELTPTRRWFADILSGLLILPQALLWLLLQAARLVVALVVGFYTAVLYVFLVVTLKRQVLAIVASLGPTTERVGVPANIFRDAAYVLAAEQYQRQQHHLQEITKIYEKQQTTTTTDDDAFSGISHLDISPGGDGRAG